MNLASVMAEMGTKLDTITGLRVTPYTADSISPPAALVELPDTYTFDDTYGRGSDSMTLEVTVAVAKVDARNAHTELAKYANGSGAHSIKSVLESGPNTAYGTLRVTGVVFGTVKFSGIAYLAAVFSCAVSGEGA
jgi:hypothetical protein